MTLYKDSKGNIHDDMNGSAIHLLPADCIKITQSEADSLRALSSIELANEKLAILNQARTNREIVLNRLTGIQMNTMDAPTVAAIQSARTALLNITSNPNVLLATDGKSTKEAIIIEWKSIESSFSAAAPLAAKAFSGIVF